MVSHALALPPMEGKDFSRYLAQIRSYPLLEADEEYNLARRWRDNGDMGAAHRLVTSHLRLVVKVAREYKGYGLPLPEVVSEGTIGLMQAVKRFDPDKGFRLTTYALWWIRAAIQEYVLRSWSVVRIGTTAAQRKLFFSLRRVKSHIQAFEEGDLKPDQVAHIADVLDVPHEDVVEMNRRMVAHDSSLNTPRFLGERTEEGGEWQDSLVDDRPTPASWMEEESEGTHRLNLLKQALDALPERDREIVVARRLQEEPETLEDLSQRLGISRERVRQLETRAFEKLCAFVQQKRIPASEVNVKLIA